VLAVDETGVDFLLMDGTGSFPPSKRFAGLLLLDGLPLAWQDAKVSYGTA
jgi:hypothetical protein